MLNKMLSYELSKNLADKGGKLTHFDIWGPLYSQFILATNIFLHPLMNLAILIG